MGLGGEADAGLFAEELCEARGADVVGLRAILDLKRESWKGRKQSRYGGTRNEIADQKARRDKDKERNGKRKGEKKREKGGGGAMSERGPPGRRPRD